MFLEQKDEGNFVEKISDVKLCVSWEMSCIYNLRQPKTMLS